MSAKINPDAFENLKREAARRLQRAEVFFHQHHTQRLNASWPPASRPGEYPHKRTGIGQGSVVYAPAGVPDIIRAGLKVRIGITENAWYMLHLERNKGRFGFAKTAEDLAPQVAAILSA